MRYVRLCPMTEEMYHAFFREYQNDPDLYADPADYREYRYAPERADAYVRRVREKQRVPLAILCGKDIAGEILFKDIRPQESAVLSIVLKNAAYKDKGIGTQAERLAVRYAFETLGVKTLYADALCGNTRSRHVLEKVGFRFTHEADGFCFYRIDCTDSDF